MKNKKSNQLRTILAAVIVYTCMLSGCAGNCLPPANDTRIQVVCTTFPQYDWVANLIQGNEENISLTLLMDKGGDLHNFQPSALDIARVSDCDLFIYVGGESDVWVDDALAEAVNPDMHVINMMDAVRENLVAEEDLEGFDHAGHDMDAVHENLVAEEDLEGFDHTGHENHGHEEHDRAYEYDEHIWLSLRNAGLIVEEISAELAELDNVNADLYRRNCDKYLSELKALDKQYVEAVAESRSDTLLFADRFPFRYLAEDYGINYYAAFEGCSAETEAGFGTVAFLVNKLDELGLGAVVVLDGSDDRLARVVIENTKTRHQQIVVLDSLQSVSRKDMEAGLTYLSAMEENLKVLKQALG